MQSEYVVEALEESDIVAAVHFANNFNLRLVVKGTGKCLSNYSFQTTATSLHTQIRLSLVITSYCSTYVLKCSMLTVGLSK